VTQEKKKKKAIWGGKAESNEIDQADGAGVLVVTKRWRKKQGDEGGPGGVPKNPTTNRSKNAIPVRGAMGGEIFVKKKKSSKKSWEKKKKKRRCAFSRGDGGVPRKKELGRWPWSGEIARGTAMRQNLPGRLRIIIRDGKKGISRSGKGLLRWGWNSAKKKKKPPGESDEGPSIHYLKGESESKR